MLCIHMYTGVNLNHSFQLLSTERYDKSDEDINELIVEWSSKHQNESDGEVLCKVGKEGALSTRTIDVRGRETAFPCCIADALVWRFRQRELRCDFAIQNGGFVRADREYAPGSSITRGIIYIYI
jgi:hypothetical protein